MSTHRTTYRSIAVLTTTGRNRVLSARIEKTRTRLNDELFCIRTVDGEQIGPLFQGEAEALAHYTRILL